MSDEELLRLAGRAPAAAPSLSGLSDDELLRMAGRAPPAAAQAVPAAPATAAPGSTYRAVIGFDEGERINPEGFANSLAQGASLGWADEGRAQVDAAMAPRRGVADLVAGRPSAYDESMQQQQQARQRYAEANPITAGAAELAGGVLGAGKVGATARGAQGLLRALPRLAGVGAASGAVAGAGTANPGERVTGARDGAAIGAVAGGAIGAATAGIGAVGRALRNALGLNPTAGDDVVLAALRRDGMSPERAAAALADAPAGTPRSLAGVAGTNTQGAVSGAAMTPGAGQREAVEAATSRMDAAPERVRDALRESTGPRQYAADLATEIKQQRWAKAGPLYDAAFANGQRIGGDRVGNILADPDVAAAYREAQKIAAREGVELAPVAAPDIRTLDFVKRALDGEIDAGFRSGKNTANAASLKKLRNELVDIMDTQGPPEYRQARAAYAGDSEVLKAAEAGADAMSMPESTLKVALRSLKSDAERDAFRKAGLDAFMNKVAATTDGSVVNGLINTPQKREVLKLLVDDPEQYALLSRRLLAEKSEAAALRRAAPTTGSQTALRGQDAGNIAGGAQAAANAATGNVMGLMQQAMAWIGQRSNGLTEGQRETLVRDLLSNDPTRQRAVLARLQARMADQARESAGMQGRRTGAAAVGGALPGLLGAE